MNIESGPNEIVLRVRLPDFDMTEVSAVQYRQQETGFITVDELMRLQKAGFRRPQEVPPKPQPKARKTLRERARERMFRGEPRSRVASSENAHGAVEQAHGSLTCRAIGMIGNGSAKTGAETNTGSIGTKQDTTF